MVRVLVDGRVTGNDGIGRYTACLLHALRSEGSGSIELEVLLPTGTPRYTRREGDELLSEASVHGADVIHTVDYRVPLCGLEGTRLVVTIHDVLRLVRPELCYSDEQFTSRFGPAVKADLDACVSYLQTLVSLPSGTRRSPQSAYEEYYARMLMWACQQATCIVTPTVTVAEQLAEATGIDHKIRVSADGIDHMAVHRAGMAGQQAVEGSYILYVGQARPHKGLGTLVAAYERSRARGRGVRLVCAGRDFAPGGCGTESVHSRLGEAAVLAGALSDAALLDVYTRALALVHLAEHEGFGFTPLEALSVGTWVVASDIPVLRETLGPAALYVDHTDPWAVAEAIDAVVDRPDLAWARDHRRQWARRYQWRQHARDVVDAYRAAANPTSCLR